MLSFDRFRARANDEGGAVAVIVALSLIALIGMVVLVVDVGGLLYRRRQMVSASDSAALAAAQSCARRGGDHKGQADAFAADNVAGITLSGGVVDSETVGCNTGREGHVTVQYSSVQKLWFAGIFGKSENNVTTKATAEWGGSVSSNPVPLIVTMNSGGNVTCTDPDTGEPVMISPDTPIGAGCYLWFDNSSSGGSFGGFGGSVFGSLNLDKWNVPEDENCNNKQLNENAGYAYNGGFFGDMDPLNYPSPTWVCSGDGNAQKLYNEEGLSNSIGKTLVFPVTDGTTIPPSETDPSKIDKFSVVGFVALKLHAVYDANETGAASGTCSAVRPMAGGTSLNLDFLGMNEGCFTAAPDTISGVTVAKEKTTQPGPAPDPCCDWTYTDSTRQLAWNAAGPAAEGEQYVVSFSWANAGVCGPQPSNASAHCIVVSWEGAQIGNGPLGGVNLGVSVVRLCDLAITGSCDTES
jgi:Flp pilus assembly protein TadG